MLELRTTAINYKYKLFKNYILSENKIIFKSKRLPFFNDYNYLIRYKLEIRLYMILK